MKKLVAIVGTICLILGFQNCSQSALTSDGVADLSGSTNGKVSALAPVVEIELSSQSAGQWTVEVSSGQIQYAEQGEVTATRCLSDHDRQELEAILNQAEVCTQDDEATIDRICSMALIPAYAVLVSENTQRTALGEARDGCGRGAKELCGERGQALREFLSYVSQNISNFKCQ